MFLTASSPLYLHNLQNLFLILLSFFFSPILTNIAIFSTTVSPYLQTPRHISHRRKWRQISSSTFRPRRILVTGIGMSKGLALSRIFYRAGHTVQGADFEPNSIPVPGRFSKSVEKFHRLPVLDVNDESSSGEYIQTLIRIIEEEGIELWVSVSGEASALEDGEAAEVIEKETGCKVVQFGLTLTETLHDKFSFIENTQRLGLNVPETHLVTSETEALSVLYPSKKPLSPSPNGSDGCSGQGMKTAGKKFIMKSIMIDDSNRANMTLLPLPSLGPTEAHIKTLNPTPFRPFVLQEFILGREYCAHSLILRGEIRAFVACPSKEMLLHYKPLPFSSALSQAMFLYLSTYAEGMGEEMTGHFSIDFLVEEKVAREVEGKILGGTGVVGGMGKEEVRGLMGRLFPIECNPRANTAVLLFADGSEELADVYLEVMREKELKGVANGRKDSVSLITPKPGTPGYYWLGHDVITLLLLPVWKLLRNTWTIKTDVEEQDGIWHVIECWFEFLEHLLYWREGIFEVWDPWPAWWAYVGYWPLRLLLTIWEGRKWKKINVATGKIFRF